MSRRTISPIEQESYAILRSRADTSAFPPLSRAVAERVVHASADLGYLADLDLDEAALDRGRSALQAGAAVVTDVAMVAAGISRGTGIRVVTAVSLAGADTLAASTASTRSAAGMRLARDAVGRGAVWVIGCAPTALFEIVRWGDGADPALVVGLPVGFVGAAESKAALRASGLPSVSNRSEKGGSAVAAAAVNALLFAAAPVGGSPGTQPASAEEIR